MAGMTVLLKVSNVKLYEDDGNGLWKDCSPNQCVMVISRNPQGLSCSILDKSTRQPCFNRWLTPKVAITHDRDDWIGWSEPSKEGLRAFGIKMKPAECVQFVDLIAAQLGSKTSPVSSLASSRAESLNPTPAPHHADAVPAQLSSLSSSSLHISARPAPQSFGLQQSPQAALPIQGGASAADARRLSTPGEEDRQSPRVTPRMEQNAMAMKIMEQRKRLNTLKEAKEDDIDREKLLMELAKKGAEEATQQQATSAVKKSFNKRKSMVDAAAFASEIKSRNSSSNLAPVSTDSNEQVWVEHEHEGFVAYRITQRGISNVVLAPTDPAFSPHETLTFPNKDVELLYRVAPFDPDQTSDVSLLGEHVSEPLVLAVLRERFSRKLVFTMLSDMLISVNPFSDVQVYSARIMENYIRLGAQNLPPHAFGLASNALRQLLQQRQSQNIVICGEQNSGKTEISKILMKFFGGVNDASSLISEKLQCASFILDSFGNAVTHRNENSSRFSKFINLQVHPESGNLIGANIETLLLEVCRLSSRPVMERNFHVFYYLLAPSFSDDVKMLQANMFVSDIGAGQTALLGADLDQIDVAEDSKNLITLLNALKLLDFSQLEISFVFSVVAACLHLKELKFFESDRVVKVRSGSDSFEFACELLGVSVDKLKEQIMSKSIRVMGQSASLQNLDLASCQASLTSLIATLYSSLFDWLMRRINATLGCAPSAASLNLGILDIVGFESEKNNGFSQLFFNYGCEKIQQLFLGKAILEEIELYQSEGLSDVKIDVANNDPIVQFYEDKTYGLFSILDAQSRLAGGTDDGFLQILLQNLSNSSAPSYIMGHRVYDRSAKSDNSFIIKHHCSPVSYNVNGLLMANKETHLRDDLIDALRSSSFAQLLQILPNATQSASIGGPVKVAAKHVGTSARFRDQLLDLTQRLRESHCHFIRCLSPNTEGNPESFHGTHMLTQLRSSGIFEAVSLRMRGFPFRKSHEQFLSMYRSLIASQTSMTPKLRCRKIITNVFSKGDGVHVGEHMVFYKLSHHKTLEAALQKAVFGQARTIQSNFRSHIARRSVRKLLQVQISCNSILQRLRGLKLDDLLRREVRATLQQFVDFRIPGVLALEKLVLRAEETEPLERQMLELLQQGEAVATNDALSAQMRELLRKCDALGIETDIVEKGKRLNSLTVLKMQRRQELAQFASSTDLDELETQVRKKYCLDYHFVMTRSANDSTQVDKAKDDNFQNTPEFALLNKQLIQIRREFCVVLIIEHAMTRGAFSAQDGARNVDVKHLKHALARADLIKSFQPQYQQRIARARMLLDLRECIQIGAWADAHAILESVMQEGLENDETAALKLHFASTSKISDVQSQIKDAVQSPGTLEQGKLEMLMAKAEHARLTGPDVSKLREILNRIQATKGLLEQAIVEKKEAQLVQSLQEGRELKLNPVLLQEGERALQRIIERKNKRLLSKNAMSTPAMQAIAISSATSSESAALQENGGSAASGKMSLIQEESVAALRYALSMTSLSVQEKRMAQAIALHVQAREMDSAVSEQTLLRSSFFQRTASKFDLLNLPMLRANLSSKPVLGWSSQPRDTSMLLGQQNQLAVRMFNDLLCIMGDKMALYPEMLANELLYQVSQQPTLRDELAVQICSQLSNNPNPESSGRGWDFLEKLLLNGPVSVDLEAQLDLFIRKNSPTQAKHLFAHYIGQLGLLPEYSLRAKRKEDARTKSLFGLKVAARKSVFG